MDDSSYRDPKVGGMVSTASRRMSLVGVMANTRARRISSMGTQLDPAAMAAVVEAHREKKIDSENASDDDMDEAGVLPGGVGAASKRPGRYDALTVLQKVTSDGRTDRPRRSSDLVGRWDTTRSRAGSIAVRSLAPDDTSDPITTRKTPTSLWSGDETADLHQSHTHQHEQLTVDSSIDDIREYGASVLHPGKVLGVLPDEYDRDVYTEFDELCNEMLTVLGEFETALEEMTIWKDDFLRQTVPSNIKLQLTLLFARLFRSKSELHEPVFELVKQVRVYSRPWLDKRYALVELEKDYQRQCHIINVAIRKMEQMQLQVERIRSEKRVALWERVTKRLMDLFPDYGEQFVTVEVPEESATEPPDTANTGMSFPQTPATDVMSRPWTTTTASGTSLNSSISKSQLRASIREYITQDTPTWRRKAKDLVKQFQSILEMQHPNLIALLGHFHRRPVPKPAQPVYISSHSGTIISRSAKVPNLRASWSMLDLRQFSKMENEEEESKQRVLKRSNSSGVLFALGKDPKLRRPLPGAAIGRREKIHSGGPVPHGSGAFRNAGFDSPSEERREDTEASTFSLRYLDSIGEAEMKEIINSFIDEHPMKIPADGNLIDQDPSTKASIHKETYTLQDVMELTLLHAQQMQLLQSEYEERIQQLENHMTETEAAHEETCGDYERRIDVLQERVKRIAQEYMKQAKEGTPPDKPHTGKEDTSDVTSEVDTDLPRPDRPRTKSTRRRRSRKKSRQRWRDRKSPIRSPIHLVQKRVLPPRHRPVFTSPPFSMSFMDRLRWFTEAKLQKRSTIQQKFRSIEMNANEERLAQYHLLRPEKDSPTVESDPDVHLPAEFMPMPGDVPPPKRKDIWAEQGINMPWGGRFNVHRREIGGMNILNLFDVAMRFHHPHRSRDTPTTQNQTPHEEASRFDTPL
ncbi:uncharacterized protein SPPG_09051 [Spizellomyces punctatus DAOM BR117]|uniref:Uncharacterized protein n=1 Tax=Spizellomyces punctatus (strain DAOM BR117) TaxID=645134 RepID=A0A0L0HMR4_SPIPD|nr:uncharacterized protein SPPG_09051 [Spizellomyces punctatus DAOM BR117]KND02215.1 hypothetical protein SPPG_09051 [Spizellomyces punctatus DAOM BR117]|eukprot:XP_016610254.1 hypothetical protein SPPG_09051 [Spizellomyces punctatus DAOM BR117]